MALALKAKSSQGVADGKEAEKSERSIVIHGLPEVNQDRPLLDRQKKLEEQVAEILGILKADSLTEVVFKMVKYNEGKLASLRSFYLHDSTGLKLWPMRISCFVQNTLLSICEKYDPDGTRGDYELRQQARE